MNREEQLNGDDLNPSWRTLEALLEKHQAMVFSIALRITGNRELAEEVAQDVFLKLHDCMTSVHSEEHAVFWLRKVAAHRAIDAARRSSRMPESVADVADLPGENNPSDPLLAQHLQHVVAGLPEKIRAVIVLRYQEDLMPEEIAQALSMPVATVKSNLQRGLEILRRKTERVLR
jgi:RNA polymerase sigma-70 factor, ECF subfamily